MFRTSSEKYVQPIWKICSSNWIKSPGIGVKIKTCLKPPPRIVILCSGLQQKIPRSPTPRPGTGRPASWPERNGAVRRFAPLRPSIVKDVNYLVVEPTHLKNMRKSNWIISPKFRGENTFWIGISWSNHYLDDHPMTCKWLIRMVIVSPLHGVIPLFNGRTPWLVNRGWS